MGAITGTMFALLFSALAGGLWIGLALGATGAVLLAIFRSIPLDKLLAQYAWNILTTQELLAIKDRLEQKLQAVLNIDEKFRQIENLRGISADFFLDQFNDIERRAALIARIKTERKA